MCGRYALPLGEIEATPSLLFRFYLCLTLYGSFMRYCKSADGGPDLIQGRSNWADQFGKQLCQIIAEIILDYKHTNMLCSEALKVGVCVRLHKHLTW